MKKKKCRRRSLEEFEDGDISPDDEWIMKNVGGRDNENVNDAFNLMEMMNT